MNTIQYSRWLAIDPGPFESAFCTIGRELQPIKFGKVPNDQLLDSLACGIPNVDAVAIEMIASYGMPVGAEVFETCVWIGRYVQCLGMKPTYLVKRQSVKLQHCHSSKAKDSNVRQALVDRFAPGQPNKGKGTKAQPGWFYGFSADIWHAYALAVYAADTNLGTPDA